MSDCKTCDSKLEPFISFGKQPIANNFLDKTSLSNEEYFFDMEVALCPDCSMVQLLEQPSREKMFHDNYAFFSGTSEYMKSHFQRFSNEMNHRFLNREDPFVVEIGCNDGIMINNFKELGIRHLGIEPSKNVANVAIKKGINTIVDFFDYDLAQKITKKNGLADLIVSANVICHIPDYNSILKGVKCLLNEKGVFVYEDPYLGAILEKTSYDQIYDEHVFLFSAISVSKNVERHGLELVDVEAQSTHGGSMRYFIAHKGAYNVSEQVTLLIEEEKQQGLDNIEKMQVFTSNVERSKNDLVELLKNLKREGKKVVGYGATSKSTTILNYCQIGPDLIDFISDTTPIKQGKYTPGTHIPVRPYSEFENSPPEYTILFAWNHKQEIMKKEHRYKGKWITYIPTVHIFESNAHQSSPND